jgi:hypothetical protein
MVVHPSYLLMLLLLATGCLAGGELPARAGNLVTNGSFESATFAGWTVAGTDGSGPGLGPEIIATNGVMAGRFGDVIAADPFAYSPDTSGTKSASRQAGKVDQTLGVGLVIDGLA